MKVVLIYGPSAAGKLTVANHLAKITGYKVFHNHQVIDLVKQLVPFGEKRFWLDCREIRFKVISIAVRENLKGLIITQAYNHPDGDPMIKGILKIVGKKNCSFVRLAPHQAELYTRVREASRKKHGKLQRVTSLKQELKRWNFYENIPFVQTLVIDNTTIPAAKVAQQIKKHYKL